MNIFVKIWLFILMCFNFIKRILQPNPAVRLIAPPQPAVPLLEDSEAEAGMNLVEFAPTKGDEDANISNAIMELKQQLQQLFCAEAELQSKQFWELMIVEVDNCERQWEVRCEIILGYAMTILLNRCQAVIHEPLNTILTAILTIAQAIQNEEARFKFLKTVFAYKGANDSYMRFNNSNYLRQLKEVISAREREAEFIQYYNLIITKANQAALMLADIHRKEFFLSIFQEIPADSLTEKVADMFAPGVNTMDLRLNSVPVLFGTFSQLDCRQAFLCVLANLRRAMNSIQDAGEKLEFIQRSNIFGVLNVLVTAREHNSPADKIKEQAIESWYNFLLSTFRTDMEKQRHIFLQFFVVSALLEEHSVFECATFNNRALSLFILRQTRMYPDVAVPLLINCIQNIELSWYLDQPNGCLDGLLLLLDLSREFNTPQEHENFITRIQKNKQIAQICLESSNVDLIQRLFGQIFNFCQSDSVQIGLGLLSKVYQEYFSSEQQVDENSLAYLKFMLHCRVFFSDEYKEAVYQRVIEKFQGQSISSAIESLICKLILSIESPMKQGALFRHYLDKQTNKITIESGVEAGSEAVILLKYFINKQENNIEKLKIILGFSAYFEATNSMTDCIVVFQNIAEKMPLSELLEFEIPYEIRLSDCLIQVILQKQSKMHNIKTPNIVCGQFDTNKISIPYWLITNSCGIYFSIKEYKKAKISLPILDQHIQKLICFNSEENWYDGIVFSQIGEADHYERCSFYYVYDLCSVDMGQPQLSDIITVEHLPIYNFANAIVATWSKPKGIQALKADFVDIQEILQTEKFLWFQDAKRIYVDKAEFRRIHNQANLRQKNCLNAFMELMLQYRFESVATQAIALNCMNDAYEKEVIRLKNSVQIQQEKQKQEEQARQEQARQRQEQAGLQTLQEQLIAVKQYAPKEQIAEFVCYFDQFKTDQFKTGRFKQHNQEVFLQALSLCFFKSVQTNFNVDMLGKVLVGYAQSQWGRFIPAWDAIFVNAAECTKLDLADKIEQLSPALGSDEPGLLSFLIAASANTDFTATPQNVVFDVRQDGQAVRYRQGDYMAVTYEAARLQKLYQGDFLGSIMAAIGVAGGIASRHGTSIYSDSTSTPTKTMMVNYTFFVIENLVRKGDALTENEQSLLANTLGDMIQSYPHCGSGQGMGILQNASTFLPFDSNVIDTDNMKDLLGRAYSVAVLCLAMEYIRFSRDLQGGPDGETSMGFEYALQKLCGAYGAPECTGSFGSQHTNRLLNFLIATDKNNGIFSKLFTSESEMATIKQACSKDDVISPIITIFGNEEKFYKKLGSIIFTPENIIKKLHECVFYSALVEKCRTDLGVQYDFITDVEILLASLEKHGFIMKAPSLVCENIVSQFARK